MFGLRLKVTKKGLDCKEGNFRFEDLHPGRFQMLYFMYREHQAWSKIRND